MKYKCQMKFCRRKINAVDFLQIQLNGKRISLKLSDYFPFPLLKSIKYIKFGPVKTYLVISD